MSNDPTMPAPGSAAPGSTPGSPHGVAHSHSIKSALPLEVRLYSHSGLFYWWPLWFFGFIFAIWTYIDGHRMVILPADSTIIKTAGGEFEIKVTGKAYRLEKEIEKTDKEGEYRAKTRVARSAAIGPLYIFILILVILITNVQLRGLWSVLTVSLMVVVALVVSLFDMWESLLENLGHLHIFINLAGYLFLGIVGLAIWLIAVFFFDRRKYMIVTSSEIRVCEHIAGGEKIYDTTGMTLEKQRNDYFRHIFLGLGTGDIIVRTSGADRHEIPMLNITFAGKKIKQIEEVIRKRTILS